MTQSKKRRTSVVLTPTSKDSMKTPVGGDLRHMVQHIPVVRHIHDDERNHSSKFNTSIKPRKSSADYGLNFGTEIKTYEKRVVSRTPTQLKRFIFPDELNSSTISALNFEIANDRGRIALRDDFIRQTGGNEADLINKRFSVKKAHFRGLSLKSIEEEVKHEESEESNRVEKVDASRDSICSKESNAKPLIKQNKTIRFKTKVIEHSLKPTKTLKPELKSDFTRKYSINAYGILKSLGARRKTEKGILFSDDVAIDNRLDVNRLRLKNCSTIQSILICISIILIVVDNETEFRAKDRHHGTIINALTGLRFINLIITLVLYILIILKIKFQNDIFKLTYSAKLNKGYTYRELLFLLLEFIISSIIIPPFIELVMDYDFFLFDVKRVISVASFIKINPIFDQVLLFSPFQNKKVKFLRSILNLELSKRSLFQSWFQENRYICLGIFPFVFFPSISYILMLSERVDENNYYLDSGVCINSNNFFEFIWITGVSFFTSNI
jgi:hypothetical protein